MSDINRRIVTTWAAHAGNVRAVMGDIRSGMMGGAQGAREFSRQQSLLNSQMRAFGTTIRYAIAGVGIYGATSSVQQLSEIQRQLGLISAIGDVSSPQGRGFTLVGKSLRGLSEEIRDASVEVMQPVQTINDAVLNLVSTLEGVPRNQLVPIISDISKAATLAQTPVDNLTQAVTGMTRLFNVPQTQKGLGTLAQEFQTMIRLVPGGPEVGSQIALQIPQLAALFAMGGGTPEQMFGFMTTALKAGGSPSTTLRGLQYLTQSIIQPQTPGQQRALRSIGVTPEFVAEKGVGAAILKLIQEIRTRGGVTGNAKRLAGIDEADLENLQDTFGPATFRTSGTEISPEASKFLKRSIGRIHGIRSLLTLALQYQAVRGDLETFDEFITDYQRAVKENNKEWKRFKDEAKLPQAAIALQAMKLDIVSAFEPILNYAAGKATGAAGLVDRHTQEVAFGGAAALGLFGANRILRGVRGRGLGLGRGFVGATAVQDAVQGGGERGSSPQNPIYTIVVGQIFGGGFGRATAATTAAETAAGGAAAGAAGSRASRILRRGGRILKFGGPLAVAGVMLDELASERDQAQFTEKNFPELRKNILDLMNKRVPGQEQVEVLSAFKNRFISAQTAEARLKAISEGRYDAKRNRIRVEGKAEVTVNVKSTGADGKTRTQKAFVTADLFGGFAPATKPPQTRGKDRTTRGGSQ